MLEPINSLFKKIKKTQWYIVFKLNHKIRQKYSDKFLAKGETTKRNTSKVIYFQLMI